MNHIRIVLFLFSVAAWQYLSSGSSVPFPFSSSFHRHRLTHFEKQDAISLKETFGVSSLTQLSSDVSEIVRTWFHYDPENSDFMPRFQLGLSSIGCLRPALTLPAYWNLVPNSRLAPIYNLFDRNGGGDHFSQRVTKNSCVDYRGKNLCYDEHDGVDLVLPVGTALTAVADGVVVFIRSNFLRGGLTVGVDHGHGLVSQYTHCARAVVKVGDVVQRGETIALSGAAGIDVAQFFGLVPPHIHFMLFLNGHPVDPYLKDGEAPHHGVWVEHNNPTPFNLAHGNTFNDSVVDGKILEFVKRTSTPTDPALIDTVIAHVRKEKVKKELLESKEKHGLLAVTALLEEAVHHERSSFPESLRGIPIRKLKDGNSGEEGELIKISIPLSYLDYDGAEYTDNYHIAIFRSCVDTLQFFKFLC